MSLFKLPYLLIQKSDPDHDYFCLFRIRYFFTRHINTKYHHFRDKVMNGTLEIHPVSTNDMLADILTKITNEAIHTRQRKRMMGWKNRYRRERE